MRPSRLSTDSAAAIIPSTGNLSGSLFPPVKSNLTRPVQRAAGGGSPARKNGAKSKDAELIATGLPSSGFSTRSYLNSRMGSVAACRSIQIRQDEVFQRDLDGGADVLEQQTGQNTVVAGVLVAVTDPRQRGQIANIAVGTQRKIQAHQVAGRTQRNRRVDQRTVDAQIDQRDRLRGVRTVR